VSSQGNLHLWSVVDLAEGLSLAYAAAALHVLGILEGMAEPVALED